MLTQNFNFFIIKTKKPFEVKINFLHNKQEKKKDEVIDAEVEND